ncbi:MAG: hypothetical protein QOE22_34 [Candidatus Parcubacteria bacterium]|jgi:hypothetical protein|nr:hypothetical protein [Candidatus Parcubacteria bacterium]
MKTQLTQNLYPSALLAGITLLAIYAITQAWTYIAFFVVQELLDRGIIYAENYDPNNFLGAPFDLLALLLTLLATIAGVMIASKLMPRIVKSDRMTKGVLYLGTAIFLAVAFILLYEDYFASSYTDVLYGAYGWIMSLAWIAAPTLAFFITSKKHIFK